MTSSLVGSEMCIRDSTTTLPRNPDEIRTAVQGWRMAQQALVYRGETKSCLLYTSDAADDM
eukprot:7438055-Prorocentrum_lima.AAC.1